MKQYKGGYTGRLLRVDLSAGTTSVEPVPDAEQWLGPRGWNAYIGWHETAPGVGPFDPENRLVFSVGPLVGSGAPTSGRMTISTIAPRNYPTPMWVTASLGGYAGAELKYTGFDSIVIQGQAAAPCYLLIENNRISLRDASDLWGEGVYHTERVLKERHSSAHQILAIGPAGENRVRFASIIHRLSNAVGNGGFGGVMGAKRLKAIVIRGTNGFPIADPELFLDAVAYTQRLTKGGLNHLGTADQGYPYVACSHGCSVKCYTRIRSASNQYGSDSTNNMTTCVDGTWVGGLGKTYEGQLRNGDKLLLPGVPGMGDAGLDLANLANDMGITSWAHYTWGHYFGALQALGITEVAGMPLTLDDPTFWQTWIMKVSHREEWGDAMAEGLARFYDAYQVGPRHLADFLESAGSRGHGWHREGRTMEKHPSPYWEHSALLYAVSTRDVTPSTHGFLFLNDLYGYPHEPRTPEELPLALKRIAQRIYGDETPVYPGMEMVEYATAWHQHRAIIKDSLGVCDWVFPVVRRSFADAEAQKQAGEFIYGDVSLEALLYRACTGISTSIEEMERPVAERIINLERCIEVRNNGRSRLQDEAVIPHYQWPDKTDGTQLSETADEFRNLLERYYDLRGWDRATGWPTAEKLRQLGLAEINLTAN
ncbi:MAG: aldehyde ferredoxin oxidoreductase N-terminal domain-containing protein [Anaerolineae bacterium]